MESFGKVGEGEGGGGEIYVGTDRVIVVVEVSLNLAWKFTAQLKTLAHLDFKLEMIALTIKRQEALGS